MSKRSVAVKLAGQEYRILSDGDDDSLQRVAGYVDDSMRAIRERTGAVDSLDVALLTALNFAREILATKEGRGSSTVDPARLRALIELVEGTVESGPPAAGR